MHNRLSLFQAQLKEPAALIENPDDLFYLTGLLLSRGTLMIAKEQVLLLVDGRYFATATKTAPCAVRLLREDTELFEWLDTQGMHSLAFDSAFTSHDRYLLWTQIAPRLNWIPTPHLLQQQRVIKEPHEIASLRKAAELTYKGYEHVRTCLQEGVTEEALAWEFERFVRTHGASGLSFESIIAFGENSAYPHHRAGKTKLGKDQLVLIDVGAIVDHYHGDLTRVSFFGHPDPELEKMLRWTKLAQRKAIEAVSPGVKLKELDCAARAVFAQNDVEELFVHRLGHGIGLQTHEFPGVKATGPDQNVILEPGMVFTIEPGLYRPGLGGVRWEDVILVTKSGCEILGGSANE